MHLHRDETFPIEARSLCMTDTDHPGDRTRGEQLIRRPRATDAVGRTLRGVFGTQCLPADMLRLIDRLDATEH
jgi:hypothetical protein